MMTGADGAFELDRLAAADYSVYANGPAGYLPIQYGMATADGVAKVLTVRDGARMEITIRAWRSATIRGHVVDERGRPVVGAQVRVFAKEPYAYGSGLSNDLGEYEITRLKPGQYAVGVPISLSSRTLNPSPPARQSPYAFSSFMPFVVDRTARTVLIPRGAPLPPSAEDGRAQIYVTAFAGGAATKERALYLPLGAGDVRSDIDITLPAVRGTRVGGIVTSEYGVAGTILTLMPFDSAARDAGRIDATAGADGTFVFVATPPGRYRLAVYRRKPPLTDVTLTDGYPAIAQDDVIDHDPEDMWADMPITIGDADVDDLAITLNRGTPLSGRVVYEDGPPTPTSALPRITLAAGRDRSPLEDRFLQAGRDRAISTRIRPGTYRIIARYFSSDHVFKNAIVNGRDIGDGPLTIGADPLGDVAFVFGRFETAIRGSVTDARGNPPTDATVFIFPADEERWPWIEEFGRSRALPISTGAFQTSGLPPGDYYAIAVDGYQPELGSAMAARLAPQAGRVTIREGVPATVALRIRDVQ